MFNKIDTRNWDRKDSYNHYFDNVPCTYSMTVNLDITNLLNITSTNNLKFFPVMLFALSKIVNVHEEFRMDINDNNEIGYYDFLNPSYCIFHNATKTFSNSWTLYSTDLNTFINNYNDDVTKCKKDFQNSKPLVGKNYFNVSCIPWTSFTGFNLNLQKGFDYLLPIFTIGKYFEENDKVMLPLALQVHHAVCDGFHLSRFINELQEYLDTFTL